MITLIFFAIASRPFIFVDGIYSEDAVLLMRYMKIKGIQTVTTRSTSVAIELNASEKQAREALNSFEVEFDTKFAEGFPTRMISRNESPYALAGIKIGPGATLKDFEPGSLVRKAYSQLVAQKMFRGTAENVSCRYWLRPWITRDLLRTETVTGFFTEDTGGKKYEHRFTYEP